MLLEIFDAEFPCKLSYFEPLCLMNKMAAENREKVYCQLVYICTMNARGEFTWFTSWPRPTKLNCNLESKDFAFGFLKKHELCERTALLQFVF